MFGKNVIVIFDASVSPICHSTQNSYYVMIRMKSGIWYYFKQKMSLILIPTNLHVLLPDMDILLLIYFNTQLCASTTFQRSSDNDKSDVEIHKMYGAIDHYM